MSSKTVSINICIFFVLSLYAEKLHSQDFIGETGIYVLSAAGLNISSEMISNDFVDGGVARIFWKDMETSPGIFDWSFFNEEIQTMENAGKKLSIIIMGQPIWLVDSLGAQSYSSIDLNPYHPTYLDTIEYAVKYDPVVIERYKVLMDSLASHYAGNPVIAYYNIFLSVSNDLPLTVADGTPYYEAVFYHPDTVINRLKDLTNHYMSLFPNTPLWNSPDHIRFEMSASGLPKNHVAKTFMEWGATTYPDRFGVWREDLSGCVIATAVYTDTHWYVMSQHPCRTGSQMVWNVQDGPQRMNNCEMVSADGSAESKQYVLDSAINAGLSIDMRYYEIYLADLRDPDLTSLLQVLHDRIHYHIEKCSQESSDTTCSIDAKLLQVYPNPGFGCFRFYGPEIIEKIEVYNLEGQLMKFKYQRENDKWMIDISHLPVGFYLLRLQSEGSIYKAKIILTNQ